MTFTIVDYGLGNIYSLINAFEYCGQKCIVANNSPEILQAEALILPGVGAYGDGMARLRKQSLDKTIINFAKDNKPILGICLGMQLLLESSEEFGLHQGLGILKGHLKSFHKTDGFDGKSKVPLVGWNNIEIKHQTGLLDKLSNNDVYFVHSYCTIDTDPSETLATTIYGDVEYCAVVGRGRIFGCQFHPEKSADTGLQIIKNFISLVRGDQ